jgi:IS5 family transposase
MRRRFEVQYEMGVKPIERIKIPTKSRDELPPVLRALQEIYTNPELNTVVFDLLEFRIMEKTGNWQNGRPGMNLWEILVLGVVRLTLDTNYDRLEHIANYDTLVRGILGVSNFGGEGRIYPLQTLKDNIGLFDERLLRDINAIVVDFGHQLVKKKEEEGLRIKVDTYALESNVHFPTDINLLWDASRKCIDIVYSLLGESPIKGWRKHRDWARRIKNAYMEVNRCAFGGGRRQAERIRAAVYEYLKLTHQLSEKLKASKGELVSSLFADSIVIGKLLGLDYFEQRLDQHINLVQRRLILGERIPHEEKVFSLFQPYTEWIQKGKAGKRVELGLKVAVCSDQYGFVVHHRVLEKEQEVELAVPLVDDILKRCGIESVSFDKGFWSPANYRRLSEKVPQVILPKKGRLNGSEYEREHSSKFKALRRKHAAVESDINALEHHGLNRCPDKGIDHFRRYATLGILALNLHRVGNILLERDRKTKQQEDRLTQKAA